MPTHIFHLVAIGPTRRLISRLGLRRANAGPATFDPLSPSTSVEKYGTAQQIARLDMGRFSRWNLVLS